MVVRVYRRRRAVRVAARVCRKHARPRAIGSPRALVLAAGLPDRKKNTRWPLRTTIYARHARTPACRRRSLLALREFVPIERGLTGRRPLERSVRVLVQALRFVPGRHASLACTPASNEQPVGSSAPSDSWPGPMQGEAIVICIIDHHVFANESLSTPTLDF
jgi:hypothetical protein